MKKIKLLIPHAVDLAGTKIAGIKNFIINFIKYSPDDFEIDFIGLTSDPKKRKLRKMQKLIIGSKEINFFPIITERNEDIQKIIPLSLRFAFQLNFYKQLSKDKVIFFNRIEFGSVYKKCKNPKIVMVHNDIEKQILQKESDAKWRHFPGIYFFYEKNIFSKMDYIFAPSQNTVQFYQKRYYNLKDNIFFQPTTLDPEIFNLTNKNKNLIRKNIISKYPFLSQNNKWIIFSGRLMAQKSPFKLITIMENILKKHPDTSMLIIGDGNLKDKIAEKIKNKKLEKKIFLLGRMLPKELSSFLSASDVMLFTSNYEGMPLAALEALACGIPIVATPVGEFNKFIKNGKNGEISKDLNTESISEKLLHVMNSLKNYSNNNCHNSILKYYPENSFKKLYEIIYQAYINYNIL